jgi:hypothetical protein
MNKQHLEQHIHAEMFLQGELNRFMRGQPPTPFQGPPLPAEMQQPIVPGYAPPAQLPAAAAAAQGQPQPQQPPGYFRQGPNGPEVAFTGAPPQGQFPAPQQQQPMMPPGFAPQMQPQMPPQMQPPPALQGQQMFGPYPPPGAFAPPPGMVYGPPPYGYYPQQPPMTMPANQLPVMQQPHDPNAPAALAPMPMPMQQPAPQQGQQFASPEAARQAVMPDAPPAPAVPTSVVQFPTPGGQDGSHANGTAQPQPK